MHVLRGLRRDTSCTMSARTAAAVLCARADPARHGTAARACASTKQLPSDKRVHLKYSVEDVAAHSRGFGIFRRKSGESSPVIAKLQQKQSWIPMWARMDFVATLLAMTEENHSAATIVPSTSPKPTR